MILRIISRMNFPINLFEIELFLNKRKLKNK